MRRLSSLKSRLRRLLLRVTPERRPDPNALPPQILRKLVGGDHWDDVGSNQFEYLKKEGLQPGHSLLDLPCGSFRAGRHFIDYLETGHYFGVDMGVVGIERGIQYVLEPLGLMEKRPTIHVGRLTAEPNDLSLFTGFTRFDYIWMHALFDHIPNEIIHRALQDMSSILVPGGKLYATIFLNPHGPAFREPMIRPRNDSLENAVVTFPDHDPWHHTIDFFQETASGIPALRLDACLYDYPHPLGLRMLRFVRESPGAP